MSRYQAASRLILWIFGVVGRLPFIPQIQYYLLFHYVNILENLSKEIFLFFRILKLGEVSAVITYFSPLKDTPCYENVVCF